MSLESAPAIVDRVAREPLSAPDAWCDEVLELCRSQGFVAHPELCGARPKLDEALCEASRYEEHEGYVYAARDQLEGEAGVGAEEEGQSPDVVILDESENRPCNSSGGGSDGGDRPAALTLPPRLLAKAYRLNAACVVAKHSTKSAAARANCEASPLCLYGLQTLRSTPKAVSECVDFCMGSGPHVLPLPRTAGGPSTGEERTTTLAMIAKATAITHVNVDSEMEDDNDSSDIRSSSSGDCRCEDDLSDKEQTATAIPPDFPCLWRGLLNLGNTCYLNSVLQLLFATAAVRRAILQDGAVQATGVLATQPPIATVSAPAGSAAAGTPTRAETAAARTITNPTSTTTHPMPSAAAAGAATAVGHVIADSAGQDTQLLASGLKEVFVEMAFSRDGRGASPVSFAKFLSIDPAVQQDAQEFLALLIDWLRCHCGPSVKTAIDETFAGALLYDRRCTACGRSAKRAEPFLYLTVPVKPTLQESLADFMKPESVEGFACEGCGQKVTATSRQYLRTLPDVLVIHINRFEFDLRTLQRQKVLAPTSFPLTLDMSPYAAQWNEVRRREQQQQQQQGDKEDREDGPQEEGSPTAAAATAATAATATTSETSPEHLYELRGVLNHLGDSATSGHYTYQGKVFHNVPPAAPTSTGVKGGAEKDAEGEDETEEAKLTWLNFNDAEVTKLNRFKGVSGVSKDAYVLVYHRLPAPQSPTKASEAGTAPAAPQPTAKERNPPPAPSEFPPYLLKYAALLNERCLAQRRVWLGWRDELAAVLSKWSQAAKALFDAPSDRLGGFTAAFDAEAAADRKGARPEPVYVLPTAWLRLLGRGFLAPFVNVDEFGDGAVARKRVKGEVVHSDWGAATAKNPLEASTPPPEAARSAATGSPVEEEELSWNGLRRHSSLAGNGAAAATGLLIHGDGAGYYRAVRRHQVEHFVADIVCPHGRIAPWGAYKVISNTAFYLVKEFLLLCGAHSELLSESLRELTAAERLNGISGGGTPSLFNLQANRCATCAAAMAAAVKELSLSSRADGMALLAMDEVAGATNSPTTAGVPPSSSSDSLVYLSEDVVKNWEAYMGARSLWQPVANAAGYTGVLTMTRHRLPPPAPPASTTNAASASASTTTVAAAVTGSALPGMGSSVTAGGAGPSVFASAAAAAAATAATASATVPPPQLLEFHRLRDNLHAALQERDEGRVMEEEGQTEDSSSASDVRSSFVCEHGGLRPDAAVRVVPEMVRQYLLHRIPALMERAGMLHDLPALRATPHNSQPSLGVPPSPLMVSLLERVLLPPLRVADYPRCQTCVSLVAHHMAAQHHLKKRRLQERKEFATLSAAGKLTDPDVVKATLMASADVDSEEQLIATQHPNRAFFKRSAEKAWREHVKTWKEQQAARIARQDEAIKELRAAAEKQKASDEAWRVMTKSARRGGRGGGGTMSLTDPRHPARQLALAEDFRAKMEKEEPPALTAAYGCLPMWWVARWYRHVNALGAADANANASAPAFGVADNSGGCTTPDMPGHAGGEEGLDTALTHIDYSAFLCPHGKLLLEMTWLNPSDGFWQGARGKRPEVLWNGMATSAMGEGTRSHKGNFLQKEDMRWTSWLPPMLIVPMEEFVAVVKRYGTPDMLVAAASSDAQAAEEKSAVEKAEKVDSVAGANEESRKSGEKPADADAPAPLPSKAAPLLASMKTTIQLLERNGERVLCPGGCPSCCQSLVDCFEDSCALFTNGTLKLQLHIRKSKKLFYDTDDVLDSKAAANLSNNSSALGAAGIHHHTTLAQLRAMLAERIMNVHGFLVPADGKLEVLRGRKPLKRKRAFLNSISHPNGSSNNSGASPAEGKSKDTAVAVPDDFDSVPTSREPSPHIATPPPAAADKRDAAASLDEATLFELGIHDGDTITVNYTDGVAAPCAKARVPGDDNEEEVWEAIPAELLMEGQAGATGAAAGEHAEAFGQTRLQSGGGGGVGAGGGAAAGVVVAGAAAEAGVSCPVCTFLNAAGMTHCEMCESPLPPPPPSQRRR